MKMCVVCELGPLKRIIAGRVELFGGRIVEDARKAKVIITTSVADGREALQKYRRAKVIMALSNLCPSKEAEAVSLQQTWPKKVKICRFLHDSQHPNLSDYLFETLDKKNKKEMEKMAG